VESTAIGSAPAKDYGTGLVLFGLLDLLIGFLFLAKAVLFALLSIPGLTPPSSASGDEVPFTALLAVPPSAFFLSLGFGSFMARRWARALAFAFSLLWLAGGTIFMLVVLVWLPRILAAVRPVIARGAESGGRALGLELRVCLAVIAGALLLPAASALFYGNAGVKGDCERRDAQPRWTDRVPIPVLVLILTLAIGALLALHIGISPTRQRVYFGHPLGSAGRAGWTGLAAAEIAAAWGLARMRRWAWVASIGIMLARGAASVDIARRISASPHPVSILTGGRHSPQAEAFLGALGGVHVFDAVMLFFAVVSAAALLLSIAVGCWFRPATAGPPE